MDKKQEALDRMKMLGLHKNVIREFDEQPRILNCSELGMGILYWLDEDMQQIVDEIEKQYDLLVYHCILDHTTIGTMLSMLYVSDSEDEWEYDHADLEPDIDGSMYPMAYVYNLSDPDLSEFGSIGIRSVNGGVMRFA